VLYARFRIRHTVNPASPDTIKLSDAGSGTPFTGGAPVLPNRKEVTCRTSPRQLRALSHAPADQSGSTGTQQHPAQSADHIAATYDRQHWRRRRDSLEYRDNVGLLKVQ
ncbi:MAG TPA: hypothetical protein VL329_02235, partial [Nitrospiraceae bacterium]|nr:hypothetical protein [Nitrospiraceae bacterium]